MGKGCARFARQLIGEGGRRGEAADGQRRLQPRLRQGTDLGGADPPGRQQAGVAGAQHLPSAEGLGHPAGDLARGATEGHQGVAARIEAALGGDAPDGLGGLLDADGDEAFGRRFRALRAHGQGELGQARAARGGVERLALVGSENRREGRRLDAAQHQVGVGDRCRSTPAVGGGTGIGAGASRTHPGAQSVESEDRTAACGHGLQKESPYRLGGG